MLKCYGFVKLILILGVCMQITANEMPAVQVLIVDGFSNHDWKHSSELLQEILHQSGGD